MKLRTKKRLVNACSLALLGVAATVAAIAWRGEPPQIELEAPRVRQANAITPAGASPVLDAASPSWQRVLRRPLYDPPPPPAQQVVVQERPITVQLMGTVIEAENSQAFVRQASGAVEIKRVGDQVTGDPADGVIGQITSTEMIIRREDGDHHVSVQPAN